MSGSQKLVLPAVRRANRGRAIRDILLVPPALIYIIIEHVFWAGAKTLLRATSRLNAVSYLQAGLQRLPAWAVLPLFLLPEIVSHLGGIWATLLLVDRKFAAATLVGVFIKGIATLLTVWIYQNCAPALLTIGWFARLHALAMRVRDWAAARLYPLRSFPARLLSRGRSRLIRRFAAIRIVLAGKLGMRPKSLSPKRPMPNADDPEARAELRTYD